jgi:hypothetical protein
MPQEAERDRLGERVRGSGGDGSASVWSRAAAIQQACPRRSPGPLRERTSA